jgi:hypothetical protein
VLTGLVEVTGPLGDVASPSRGWCVVAVVSARRLGDQLLELRAGDGVADRSLDEPLGDVVAFGQVGELDVVVDLRTGGDERIDGGVQHVADLNVERTVGSVEADGDSIVGKRVGSRRHAPERVDV